MTSEVKVCKLSGRDDLRRFVRFGHQLYANCPYYVPDLDSDIYALFSPRDNAALAYSTLEGFLAFRGEEVVGRVAAFINRRTNERWKTRTVRFTYLDFVDDAAVSAALFHAVEEWGREQGMDTVEGPMGFTDFDKEGMLISDFDQIASIITAYNYPYYQQHLEALGYLKATDWIQIKVNVPSEVPERYARVADVVRRRFHLRTLTLTRHDILEGGYGLRIFQLLNEAYAPLFGFTEIDPEQTMVYVRRYLPLVDLRLVPVVINDKGELIGFAACMPSIAKAMRKTHGKLFPFGWWHLLSALKWKRSSQLDLLLIAVRPDFQGLGVNALFFDHIIPICHKLGYTVAETGPQLEDNTKELSQWNLMHPQFTKRRRCYRKSL